jgi:hypothetical protein
MPTRRTGPPQSTGDPDVLAGRLLDLEWTIPGPPTADGRRDLEDLRTAAALRDMTGVVRRIDALTTR